MATEWEWQAVADHTVDDPYIYGCGLTINHNIANYWGSIHPDGTTIAGAFGTYGYDMADMAGNVSESTSTIGIYDNRMVRGGYWDGNDRHCTVSYRSSGKSFGASSDGGFRVCR